MTMNETPIEEIPTYDHEETIGNDDTIDEEETTQQTVLKVCSTMCIQQGRGSG